MHFLRRLVGLLDWYVRRQVIHPHPTSIFPDFFASERDFTGIGVLVAVSDPYDVYQLLLISSCKVAKDVGTSRDTLTDLFERIEDLFKRLETYTKVPLTHAMTDTIVKILVEVSLRILAIATKEIKQGSASEPIIFDIS